MARRYPKNHKNVCPHGHNLSFIRRSIVDNNDGTKDGYVAYWCKRCEQNYVIKNGTDFYYNKE